MSANLSGCIYTWAYISYIHIHIHVCVCIYALTKFNEITSAGSWCWSNATQSLLQLLCHACTRAHSNDNWNIAREIWWYCSRPKLTIEMDTISTNSIGRCCDKSSFESDSTKWHRACTIYAPVCILYELTVECKSGSLSSRLIKFAKPNRFEICVHKGKSKCNEKEVT